MILVRSDRNPLTMTAARPAAKIQRDPEDNKRKENERQVREVHDTVLTSMRHYSRLSNLYLVSQTPDHRR
jgi:hypothetical protein